MSVGMVSRATPPAASTDRKAPRRIDAIEGNVNARGVTTSSPRRVCMARPRCGFGPYAVGVGRGSWKSQFILARASSSVSGTIPSDLPISRRSFSHGSSSFATRSASASASASHSRRPRLGPRLIGCSSARSRAAGTSIATRQPLTVQGDSTRRLPDEGVCYTPCPQQPASPRYPSIISWASPVDDSRERPRPRVHSLRLPHSTTAGRRDRRIFPPAPMKSGPGPRRW